MTISIISVFIVWVHVHVLILIYAKWFENTHSTFHWLVKKTQEEYYYYD